MSKTLDDVDDVLALAKLLNKSPKVAEFNKRYPNPNQSPEADALANAFRDIEKSSTKVFEQLIPQFKNENLTGGEITEVLLEIGEEFRHILYHIQDPKFFKYLIDE